MTAPTRVGADRVPRTFWVGLLALVVYLLFAAVLANILSSLFPTDDSTAEFALTHFIPLPFAIILALLFVRWSGWSKDIWREPSTLTGKPRRAWLIIIPVAMLILPLAQLPMIPWAERGFGTVAIVVVGTAMVGFGEELVCRGILLTSIRARHGELVTLLLTSALFAAAHLIGSLWAGIPIGTIGFQMAVLMMNGSLYYWVRRVTGRLWVAMSIHAFTDCALYLNSGAGNPTDALTHSGPDSSPILAIAQTVLAVAALFGVISAIREDVRARRAMRESRKP